MRFGSPGALNELEDQDEHDISNGSADEPLAVPGSFLDDDSSDDWAYEATSSTEEVDTEWDNKRDTDVTVGLDTIIDSVD